jgi:hypothetical protein
VFFVLFFDLNLSYYYFLRIISIVGQVKMGMGGGGCDGKEDDDEDLSQQHSRSGTTNGSAVFLVTGGGEWRYAFSLFLSAVSLLFRLIFLPLFFVCCCC